MINSKDNRLNIFIPSVNVHCAMKNKLSEHIKSFSFHIMYFYSYFGSFCQHFLRILYFCDYNGPTPNVILVSQTLPVTLKIYIYGYDRMYSKL